VLGAIGRDPNLEIPERHLGLIPANETRGMGETMITRLADAVLGGVDLDRAVEIAAATSLPTKATPTVQISSETRPDVRIAIARDAAFGFYYQDDLEAFATAGAELVPFDTLNDAHLPNVDGLFIGGGFPETQLDTLADNQTLLADIHKALAAGMPAYAECGGLMYLARSIEWRGHKRNMVGAVPVDVLVGKLPQGKGYMSLEETDKSPWPQVGRARSNGSRGVPVHEFHYAWLENLEENPIFAQRVLRGTGIDGKHDGLVVNNLLAGFAHHRNTLANPWVERFVSFVCSPH